LAVCQYCQRANASATISSVAETAKENSLNPFEYLKFLFKKMPNMNLADRNVLSQFYLGHRLCLIVVGFEKNRPHRFGKAGTI
jgi:hypothetical protein